MRDEIVISPFSNNLLRDWPVGHYIALVGELVKRWPTRGTIHVIGTQRQRMCAHAIVRGFDPDRVVNACGRLLWPEVLALLDRAACVIGNNSGITHLAGQFDSPTVCIFGGSHHRMEWRPIGAHVVTLSRAIGCAPCGLHDVHQCPYARACLRLIEPVEVADTVLNLIASLDGCDRDRHIPHPFAATG